MDGNKYKEYDIDKNSGSFNKIDDVYYETMKNDARVAALIGPLGGMIGGPMGGITNLAAINSLMKNAQKELSRDDYINRE